MRAPQTLPWLQALVESEYKILILQLLKCVLRSDFFSFLQTANAENFNCS